MTEHNELLPNLLGEDAFEMQMRGYSRRQVDEYVARSRSQTRDLEERLARALDDAEQLRQQLAAAHEQPGARPPHEEVSERIAQILKLADDEAKAQKARANEDIAKVRSDAQREADAVLTEAREKADRMLTSAQDQAENFVSAARAEADKTRESARAEADKAAAESRKEAEEQLASARSKAERMLAESTARSTAINEGAARRLELLSGTHAEAARRLTEIRDVVTELLSRDAARGSLEDEVAKAVSSAVNGPGEAVRKLGADQPADSRMARKTTKGTAVGSDTVAGSDTARHAAPSRAGGAGAPQDRPTATSMSPVTPPSPSPATAPSAVSPPSPRQPSVPQVPSAPSSAAPSVPPTGGVPQQRAPRAQALGTPDKAFSFGADPGPEGRDPADGRSE